MVTDGDFLSAFEATTWPKSDWTHRAHLRMAWLYLEAHPFDVALERIRKGIQRYNGAHGVPTGYHDTVTQAFALLVEHRRRVSPPGMSFEDFAERWPELFVRSPSPLARHYREATIASPDARARFVAPDLDPLPAVLHTRDATPADVRAIQHIYAPYVTESAVSFEANVPSVSEIERRMSAASLPWLVGETPNFASSQTEGRSEVVAYAYASPYRAREAYRWTVEVTVYVSQSMHKRGIGKILYTDLFTRLTAMGYRQAIAGITLPNEGSVALHESLGFSRVGTMRSVGFKLGRWHDVGFWQRALAVGSDPPREPGLLDDSSSVSDGS